MARYQVRQGRVLPHDGRLVEAGEIVVLPRHVGTDPAIRDVVDEVDEAGNPILAPLTDEFERFRPHEQVTLIQARLAEAKARVETLEGQLANAEAASAVAIPGVAVQDEE